MSRVAVVTGANRGIGQEVTRQLAGRGDTVILGTRDVSRGEQALAALGPLAGTMLVRPLDVTSAADAGRLAAELADRFGRVDVLINNAAIHYDTGQTAAARTLAAELRPAGILVNSVCPGWVATDMGGPGGPPVALGGERVLWAADLPDGGPTGGFYRDGQPVPW
jgi:NAD(P)-dependent dehydrogenase (short-subunit alcohol dehydrogenase family)